MDSSAIKLIQQTAIDAANANRIVVEGGTPAVILSTAGGGQEVESLEHLSLERARYRGVFSTPSFDDFVNYVQANAGPVDGKVPTFVNVDTMSARSFFNLGDFHLPGHGDWTGSLTLKPTAAFKALCSLDGTKFKQKDLAEFLEDWNDFLFAEYPNGDGDLKRAIAAIRKVTITKQGESTHGISTTGVQRSAMEQIEAKSDELPIGFTWVCEPYVGLKERTFRLALSVITTGEVPIIVLRWQRREAVIEDIAKEFKATLQDRLGVHADVTVGSFNP